MNESDVALMQEALALEFQAVARYTAHAAATQDPRFVVYWESLRRNEAEHRDELSRRLLAANRMPTDTLTDIDALSAADEAAAPDSQAPGFRSVLAALRDDLGFERSAVKVYGHGAVTAHDPAIKALFRELSRGEAGHARGLRTLAATLTAGGFPVVLFCPLCGWQIDLGPEPMAGREVGCPMCPGRFVPMMPEGDWQLQRIARSA